jgi:hypothetical protein
VFEARACLIRETSDVLAKLAREKLTGARLAYFPITDSIDSLTLGTVNFLPKRFAELISTLSPPTEAERKEFMPRLQQVLTTRLSMSELPRQFTGINISKERSIMSV